MKSSSAKKAFADPQSLAVTPTVAAALRDTLQKTPLQVEQRLRQLMVLFGDRHVFSSASPLSSAASTSASNDDDLGRVKSAVQVLDQNFGTPERGRSTPKPEIGKPISLGGRHEP